MQVVATDDGILTLRLMHMAVLAGTADSTLHVCKEIDCL